MIIGVAQCGDVKGNEWRLHVTPLPVVFVEECDIRLRRRVNFDRLSRCFNEWPHNQRHRINRFQCSEKYTFHSLTNVDNISSAICQHDLSYFNIIHT